ncbi:MAG: hypothetical protein COA79_24505 [Planctomycetota bacterium]|nr:MAG: hypothetical protein COA79_24505 [Planctomycetota bacterium]
MKFNPAIIQINITDLEIAKSFYGETLGFEIDHEKSLDGVCLLKSDGDIPILLYPVPQKSNSQYGENAGPVLVIEVADIFKVYKDWKKKDVQFIPVPWSEDETGIGGCPFGLFIAFKDPDGNVHEILQPH